MAFAYVRWLVEPSRWGAWHLLHDVKERQALCGKKVGRELELEKRWTGGTLCRECDSMRVGEITPVESSGHARKRAEEPDSDDEGGYIRELEPPYCWSHGYQWEPSRYPRNGYDSGFGDDVRRSHRYYWDVE